MKAKTVVQLATMSLLMAVNVVAVAQPAVTPLPQANQPQISEQTKALFKQRWADGPAAAANANNAAVTTTQTAAQFVPATAKSSAAAATAPSDNRTNQQTYLNQINQALKGK